MLHPDLEPVSRAQGAVRMFRWWILDERDDRMRSSSFEYRWEPGVNVAEDLFLPMARKFQLNYVRGDKRNNRLSEGPGFYGFLSYEDLLKRAVFYPWGAVMQSPYTNYVLGTVLGFGRVTLHEYGARCDKAVVESLMIPPVEEYVAYEDRRRAARERVEKVAEYYGVLTVRQEVLRGLPGGLIEGQAIRL